jgi:hypothetical protein
MNDNKTEKEIIHSCDCDVNELAGWLVLRMVSASADSNADRGQQAALRKLVLLSSPSVLRG